MVSYQSAFATIVFNNTPDWHIVETFSVHRKLRFSCPGVKLQPSHVFLQRKVVHFTRWQGGFYAAVPTDLYPFILDLWGHSDLKYQPLFFGLGQTGKNSPSVQHEILLKEALTMAWPSWREAGLSVQR